MPQNTISLPGTRTTGQAFLTNFIGSSMNACNFDQAVSGSMWCAPFRLPADFDPSYPSYVYADLAAVVGNATAGLATVVRVNMTHVPAIGTPADLDVQIGWPIPNPWTAGDVQRILFDDGTGVTYPGGTFLAGDMVGMLLRRVPGDAVDNYLQPLRAAASLTLVYHQRCQRFPC